MTEEQRKEMVSREFLRVLAYSRGFKIIEPQQDHGVDMVVCPVTERTEPDGRSRFLDSQFKLDFQLKSTTTARIAETDDHIPFDLEVKNYNDLISRRDEILPLHLVVVILSNVPPHCVSIDESAISVLGRAFWYLPPTDAEVSDNAASVRIKIPKQNILGSDFVRACYANLGIEV